MTEYRMLVRFSVHVLFLLHLSCWLAYDRQALALRPFLEKKQKPDWFLSLTSSLLEAQELIRNVDRCELVSLSVISPKNCFPI